MEQKPRWQEAGQSGHVHAWFSYNGTGRLLYQRGFAAAHRADPSNCVGADSDTAVRDETAGVMCGGTLACGRSRRVVDGVRRQRVDLIVAILEGIRGAWLRRDEGGDVCDEARDISVDGHVGRHDANLAPVGSQALDGFPRTVGRPTTSDEREMTRATGNERSRGAQAKSAVAAGDDIGAIAANDRSRWRDGRVRVSNEPGHVTDATTQRNLVVPVGTRDDAPDLIRVHRRLRLEIDSNAPNFRVLES